MFEFVSAPGTVDAAVTCSSSAGRYPLVFVCLCFSYGKPSCVILRSAAVALQEGTAAGVALLWLPVVLFR